MSEQTLNQGDLLYEKYGKPLEPDHWGEFVAISPEGKTVIGSDLHEVTSKAGKTLGRGHYLFKVGEKVLGNIR
jgi:hypothetical protein